MQGRVTARPSALILWMVISAVVVLIFAYARPSGALPAFARKYGTSCLTCHTVYPKLNPFGEAFRHNGYLFPGIDSDFAKQETIAMGQEAYKKAFPNSVWPGTLPGSAPLAVGFNGRAVGHPDKRAGGTKADNGARFITANLIEEGHLWAGASFDDKITFFGELTVSGDGAELEYAHVHANDLVGPKHALNLAVGKMLPTLSSFGPHSTYLSDMAAPGIAVTALYGATSDSWSTQGSYNGIEVSGTLRGRFGYALGTNAGANLDTRETENLYAHAEYRLGGMRMDGEDSSGVANPMKPWAENAITLGGFYYRAVSRFAASDETVWKDTAPTAGTGLRAQWGSLELDTGIYAERHDHATADGSKVNAVCQYDEISYVLYPWLVPAARIEYSRLKPAGEDPIHDLRVFAGAAALVRPNLKLTITAQIERAKGAPAAGWGAVSGLAMPSSPGATVDFEVEAVTIEMSCAF
jgi:hypothetical protein